jgi:hypothetical protein
MGLVWAKLDCTALTVPQTFFCRNNEVDNNTGLSFISKTHHLCYSLLVELVTLSHRIREFEHAMVHCGTICVALLMPFQLDYFQTLSF